MVITRKGAISTRDSDLALIPGSMGVGSYIVRGLANPDSFYSAAHGAGRTMSRNAARKTFTVKDLQKQTRGVETRKDEGVLDEAGTSAPWTVWTCRSPLGCPFACVSRALHYTHSRRG